VDGTEWQGLQVLMIEPEESIATPLAAGLRTLGANVVRVVNGRSTLAHLRGHAADAVLMAAPLPDADWEALAAWIRQRPEPPILIVLRNLAREPDGNAETTDGCADAVLERAAKLEEIGAAIEAAWSSRGESVAEGTTSVHLPELLVARRACGDSGVLEIRAEGICTRIFLHCGAPVFAEGGALRETLGRMLLQRGALTEADYVRVIERMTERLMESETTRMGEVLVELGLLTPAEVFVALSEQVREKIISCLRWERFTYGFEAVDTLPQELGSYPSLQLEDLILDGVRAHYGPDRLESLLVPFAARRPTRTEDLARLTSRFRLSPVEQRLLRLVDGQHTLAEVRNGAPLDPVHSAQVLAALLLAGGIVWDDPARSHAAEVKTPVALGSASERVRSIQSAPAPRGPSRMGPPRSLAQLRQSLARAGREGPKPIDPKTASLESERAFRQGLQLLERSAVSGALRAFGRACALRGDEPEYRMYEAWAALLAAPDDDSRALARAKVKACAQRMLQHDRDSARAHGMLGQILLAAGEFDHAEGHFRSVLRSAPADRDALRGLRMIERRRGA
jgi:CheY-like chemotaxis protein